MTDARTLTTDPPPHAAASPGTGANGRADDLAVTAGLSPAPVPQQRHVPLVQELADELRTLRSSFEGVRFLMRDTEAQLNAVQARLQQLGREATALAPATRFGSAPVTPPFPEHDAAPAPTPVVQDTIAPPAVLRDAEPTPVGATPDAAAPTDAALPFDASAADPGGPAPAPEDVAPAADPAPAVPPPGAATPYVPNPTPGAEAAPAPTRAFDTDPAPTPAPGLAAAAPAPSDAAAPPDRAAAAAQAPVVAEPAAAPAPTPAPASGNLEEMARARLVALTMAANQATPDEIERHLRDDLGIADPSVLVDYVFGTGTPDSVVPGWPPQGGAGR